jgi:adenosylmethionine-8-amino-7-oxononanoate aminotransferase
MKNLPEHVFPRTLGKNLPPILRAEGMWLEDETGNRYMDASGGAVVVNVGHGREEIARAVHDQILRYDYIHPTMFSSPVVAELADGLAANAPDGIDRFYFLASGSEAIEAAIKLARQIHLAHGRPDRFRLVSRWKSYHGLTMGALSAMGRTSFRAPYAPMLNDAVHIPPPYCLRCSYGLEPSSCGYQCALALEETVENLGPGTVSAFLAETVSGGTLAAYPPPPGYWKVIRDICDRYRVLLILDEVMCGMGRTGRWFACDHYNLEPDIMALGKGISNGVVPLSAIGLQNSHYKAIRGNQGGFVHGGTHTHHSVSAAAGLAVLRILERENLVAEVAKKGKALGDLLRNALGEHPHVADVRGMGFLWGVELVKDKDSLEPFKRSDHIAEKVWDAAFARGIVIYRTTGLAGTDGDGFLVAPPFIATDEDLNRAVDRVYAAVRRILG